MKFASLRHSPRFWQASLYTYIYISYIYILLYIILYIYCIILYILYIYIIYIICWLCRSKYIPWYPHQNAWFISPFLMSFPWWHPPGGLAWLPQQFLFDANTRQGVWTPRAGRSAMLFACFCSKPQLKMDWVHLTRLEAWSSFRTCPFSLRKAHFGWQRMPFHRSYRRSKAALLGRGVWIPRPGRSCSAGWRVWWFWVGKACDFHGILTWFNQQSFGIEPFHGDIMRKVHCIWGWIKTYCMKFGGMNIHLPAMLVFAREPRLNEHYINV